MIAGDRNDDFSEAVINFLDRKIRPVIEATRESLNSAKGSLPIQTHEPVRCFDTLNGSNSSHPG